VVVRYGFAAEHELAKAVDFYERERAGLGDEFLQEVQRAAGFLVGFPQLGRSVRKNRRVLVLKRFPYLIVYDLEKSGIRIIAVAHQSRRSSFWWGRVEETCLQYGPMPVVALRNWCQAPNRYNASDTA
jgi:plasmid stabilization system protein ParE